jgi:hypothetical protein
MTTQEKKYLILNITANNHFEGRIMSEGELYRYEYEDFSSIKKTALDKNITIVIVEATEPIVKIIPEVKVILNK